MARGRGKLRGRVGRLSARGIQMDVSEGESDETTIRCMQRLWYGRMQGVWKDAGKGSGTGACKGDAAYREWSRAVQSGRVPKPGWSRA